MVLARKYRPKKLSDLIGQEVVVQTLTNAVKFNKLHHAYLLVGKMGSGKTSLARILAAMENCEVSPGLNPCGKCSVCVGIFEGKHQDIEEIDAASGAGKVEQIRELRTAALYSPVDGARTKYFILDECLPAKSMISMAVGNKIPIGELVESYLAGSKIERHVYSRDMSTGEIIVQKIIRYIKIPNDKQMYEIKIKDNVGDGYVWWNTNILQITGNHSIFVLGDGKVKVENLKVGQKVYLHCISPDIEGEIVSIDKIDCADNFVYNLEVESKDDNNKNYFADDILVSNCHRLSGQSAEALLKLIEEPPPRVRFVLCTTEMEQMINTIVSRCQVHEFNVIPWRQISQHLQFVAEKENIEIDKEPINLCARLANGSMRNALQNLEKLWAYAGNRTITAQDADKVFATVPEILFYDVIDHIIGMESKPDATAGFRVINKMLQNGTEFNSICDGLAEKLSHIMIGLSSTAGEFISVSEEGARRLKTQWSKLKTDGKLGPVLAVLRLLQSAREQVRYGLSPESALQHWFLESIFAFHQK